MQRLIAEGWRIVRFGLVGGAATLTQLGASLAAHALGAAPWLAIIIGFVPAFAVSFLGHKTFTFGHGSWGALFRFLTIALVGLAVAEIVLPSLTRLGIVNSMLRIAISTLLMPFVTYLAARFWAFRKNHDAP